VTRTAEASLLISAAVVAGMGVALVNFSGSEGIDAQVALTVGVFLLAFGAIHFAIRQWAPGAVPFIFPIAALLAAIGFVEVYRLNRRLGSDQRWWLLVSAAAAVAILFWLREAGVAILRRYRYLFLFVALGVLLLPLLPGSWVLHGAEINGSRLWVFLDLPGTTFVLGGGSSPWLQVGGTATCVGYLKAYGSHGGYDTIRDLAQTAPFSAN